MGAFKLLILLLTLGLEVVAQNVTTPTIQDIAAQLEAYVQEQNATLSARQFSGCSLACGFLSATLWGTISTAGSSTYNYEESRYWSQQQANTDPTCRFSPTSALEVSFAILTLQVTQCEFAVKSGGHAAFSGASNIQGGVTIDLINLNEISVSADKTQTSIGPGNRWYDVYSYLEPLGLSVIGGRVSDIGVGGLTLGGGISFFSSRYGWACDNVNTYEVVFADGTINEVTYHSYPDLYFALRGGGNNFGIVTRFDLVTFPQGDLWAGGQTYFYSEATATELNNAFYWLNINAPSDPYAQVILAYAYVQAYGLYVIASDLQYSKPVVNPPILQNFTSTPGAIANTLAVVNLTTLTQEFNASNPGGNRQTYWALMVKNSPTLITDIVAIFQEEVNAVANVTGILPSLAFQPISTDMTSHFSKNGGNALGISPADGPLNLLNLVFSWTDASDDAAIFQASRNIINRSNATAYAQNLGYPYIYQNYAALEQPVFPSYGAANLAKLQAVSKKYDPNRVWQKLQPGYFKLF
jgi:hypothetical protein